MLSPHLTDLGVPIVCVPAAPRLSAEQEQQQQQQKEQEQEMEDETDDYRREKYSRAEEYGKAWELASLALPPSESVQGFFPASDFSVHRSFLDKRGPLHWPPYVQFSSDHTHPRWRFQGHHRLKNVIVLMEWSPNVDTTCTSSGTGGVGAAAMAMAALSDGQRHRLNHVFQMYDAEGRSHLSEDRLRLILADMGLDPERDESDRIAIESLFTSLRAAGGTNIDPVDRSLRVPAFEFLRIMQAQEFLCGEAGRYWVALSLREAESLRGAMHAAMDADKALISGKRVSVGLRIGDMLLDSLGASQADGTAAAYPPPPRQQLHCAVQAWRLIDCQTAFSSYQCRLLLRILRTDSCDDRRRWVNDTASCRRRPQTKIEQLRGTGLPTVLRVEDEYHVLVQSATVWRLSVEMSRRQLGTHDLFHAFNGTRNGLLSCGELGAGLKWLGLQVTESDLHSALSGLDTEYADAARTTAQMWGHCCAVLSRATFIRIPARTQFTRTFCGKCVCVCAALPLAARIVSSP